MVFEEQLIEFVRKYPLIYNLKDSDYKKMDKKDVVWKSIANELGYEGKYI